MNITATRINTLKEYNLAMTYVEIGVHSGDTFLEVTIPNKIGIDPYFHFNYLDYHNSNHICLFQMTSDSFFNDYSLIKREIWHKDIIFDFIFLDGLHRYEQTLRDFNNCLRYASQNCLILLDDTLPRDAYSAYIDQSLSVKYRRLAGLKGSPWHGDVFKCIYDIYENYPFYSYATIIDNGNPQTLVWKTKEPANRVPLPTEIPPISNLTYFDLLNTYHILNPVKDENIYSYIGDIFSGTCFDDSLGLEDIIVKVGCN